VSSSWTSNYRPDDLYPNGLQRSRFLRPSEILKRDLDVVELGGAVDTAAGSSMA